jgi:hypothetical protein
MNATNIKNQTLLSAATTGTSQPVDVSTFKNWTIVCESAGTTSGGTLLIEEAYWPSTAQDFTGTWSQLYSISASAFSGTTQQLYHFGNDNAYRYVRVRVSSTITGGGTITVYLCATE